MAGSRSMPSAASKRVGFCAKTSIVVALVIAAGCAHARTLDARIAGLRSSIETAERNGAYTCAPRELALAKSNLEFASEELEQGNVPRAEQHFAVAEPNALAAVELSQPERCLPHEEAPPPPPPAAPVDTDGDGYLDPQDGCPNEPEDFDGVADQDGCPDDQDSDLDGLADSRDLCPADPEDVDGYLDTDGCPEVDNDADGVLDAADRCANDPEDFDSFEDENGCPDRDNDTDGLPDAADDCPNEAGPADNRGCPRVYRNVEVTGTNIRIHQTIQFEFNKAIIRPVSFPILDTVAQVLRDFPTITVEVQGHTDDRGNDDYNMRLSDQRAQSVREYLVGRGIDPTRLQARGYGETRPIESNRTGRGRAVNRRVEFVRTDPGATGAGTSP